MKETLGRGDAERAGRSRALPRLVVGLLAFVLACGWAASEVAATRSRAEVSDCARRAEVVIRAAETRLAALASHIAPSMDRSTYRTYQGLFAVLSEDAAKHLPSVEQANRRCRDVDVWWTHFTERRVRDAYVAWTASELERLRRVAQDGRLLDDGYAQTRRLQRDAEAARRGL